MPRFWRSRRSRPSTVAFVDLELAPVSEDDVEAVHSLCRRWEVHWDIPEVTSVEVVRSKLFAPEVDLSVDSRAVWIEGRLVAFGLVDHAPSGERLERAHLEGMVDPEYRGLGIGRRLLAWQIERAAEKLRECDPRIPWYVRTQQYEWVDDSQRLYRRFSMVPVRWFEEMIRPLSLPLDAPLPANVEVVPWSEVPFEDTLRVSNESFADHWGSTPLTAESWQHWLSFPGMRPDLSFVAAAGSEVIGICLNAHWPDDRELSGRLDGWIVRLGVSKDWRRRGIGAALIGASIEAFRREGFTHAALGVDADSPTGASRLYHNLGFEPLHRLVTHQLEIQPEG